jgi:hypothetical protein
LRKDSTQITDWIQIRITFKSKCIECGKDISPGIACWSNSAKAAIHLTCNEATVQTATIPVNGKVAEAVKIPLDRTDAKQFSTIELKCFICGRKTGCKECEYLRNCEPRMVAKYCICHDCVKQEHPLNAYQQSSLQKLKNF